MLQFARDKYRVLDPNNTILTNDAPPGRVLLLLNKYYILKPII